MYKYLLFFFWPIWGCPRPQFSTTFRIPSIYILSSTTTFLFFFFYFLSHNNYGTRTYYTATVIISLWHYNERKFYKPKSKLRWTLLTLMSVLRVKPPSTIINRPYELPRIVYMGVYKTFFLSLREKEISGWFGFLCMIVWEFFVYSDTDWQVY